MENRVFGNLRKEIYFAQHGLTLTQKALIERNFDTFRLDKSLGLTSSETFDPKPVSCDCLCKPS